MLVDASYLSLPIIKQRTWRRFAKQQPFKKINKNWFALVSSSYVKHAPAKFFVFHSNQKENFQVISYKKIIYFDID